MGVDGCGPSSLYARSSLSPPHGGMDVILGEGRARVDEQKHVGQCPAAEEVLLKRGGGEGR